MNWSTKIVLKMFRSSKLPTEDRAALFTVLLDKLYFPQKDDIIRLDQDGTLLLNGRPVDLEQASKLREGATNLLESQVRQFVRDQVIYHAIQLGIHKADSVETLMFSKAVLWWSVEEQKLLELLAQQ